MEKRTSYISIFALLVVTAFVLGCQNVKTSAVNNTGNTANVTATPSDDAPRISLADAKAAYDAGTALFVDTRAEAAYKQEHVKGAINLPMDKLEAKLKELPKDKKIIAYCS